MKIGVLETGTVGRVIGARFAALGHEVTIGTRDAVALLVSTEPDQITHETLADWHATFVSGRRPGQGASHPAIVRLARRDRSG